MSEHTPIPWTVGAENSIWRIYRDEEGRKVKQPICETEWPIALSARERSANAEFIVEACNGHKALEAENDAISKLMNGINDELLKAEKEIDALKEENQRLHQELYDMENSKDSECNCEYGPLGTGRMDSNTCPIHDA